MEGQFVNPNLNPSIQPYFILFYTLRCYFYCDKTCGNFSNYYYFKGTIQPQMACSTVIHAAFFFDVSIFMIQYTWMAYAAQMDVTNIKMRNLEKCNISLS